MRATSRSIFNFSCVRSRALFVVFYLLVWHLAFLMLFRGCLYVSASFGSVFLVYWCQMRDTLKGIPQVNVCPLSPSFSLIVNECLQELEKWRNSFLLWKSKFSPLGQFLSYTIRYHHYFFFLIDDHYFYYYHYHRFHYYYYYYYHQYTYKIVSAVVIVECLVAAISYLWEKGRTPRNRRSMFKNELVVNTFGIFLVCVLENLWPQKNLRPPGYKYFYQQSKILPHSSRCHFEYWSWCTGKVQIELQMYLG